ncbi:MAG: hypothetical protein WBN75_15455 [Verrucomicrobiia bacterium]
MQAAGAGANILTNSGLNHFDSRRTVPLDAGHAESVLGTNATALTLAVARFKEQWPQIQLDYNPVLLSPKSVLPPRLSHRPRRHARHRVRCHGADVQPG